jgi:hypothetical protein
MKIKLTKSYVDHVKIKAVAPHLQLILIYLPTYLPTYLSQCRVLEELIVLHLAKKSHFYGTQGFIAMLTSAHTLS